MNSAEHGDQHHRIAAADRGRVDRERRDCDEQPGQQACPPARDSPADERRQHDDSDGDEHVREPRRRDELRDAQMRGRRHQASAEAAHEAQERGTREQPERGAGIVLHGRVHQLPGDEVVLDVRGEAVLVDVERDVSEIPIQAGQTHREGQRDQCRQADLEGVVARQDSEIDPWPLAQEPVGELREAEEQQEHGH